MLYLDLQVDFIPKTLGEVLNPTLARVELCPMLVRSFETTPPQHLYYECTVISVRGGYRWTRGFTPQEAIIEQLALRWADKYNEHMAENEYYWGVFLHKVYPKSYALFFYDNATPSVEHFEGFLERFAGWDIKVFRGKDSVNVSFTPRD